VELAAIALGEIVASCYVYEYIAQPNLIRRKNFNQQFYLSLKQTIKSNRVLEK
jgi:hypothetical protein